MLDLRPENPFISGCRGPAQKIKRRLRAHQTHFYQIYDNEIDEIKLKYYPLALKTRKKL